MVRLLRLLGPRAVRLAAEALVPYFFLTGRRQFRVFARVRANASNSSS